MPTESLIHYGVDALLILTLGFNAWFNAQLKATILTMKLDLANYRTEMYEKFVTKEDFKGH